MSRRSAFTLLLAVAAAAFYGCEPQMNQEGTAAGGDAGSAESSVDFASHLADEYEQVREWIDAAADDVSEEEYGHRPTEEVRSFGELIAHLAGARYAYCGAARDEQPPQGPDEGASKDELVEAIQAAGDYCAEAYDGASDATLGSTVQVFGSDARQIDALMGNLNHENQHYGNIVTYMREMGRVPPSSQG